MHVYVFVSGPWGNTLLRLRWDEQPGNPTSLSEWKSLSHLGHLPPPFCPLAPASQLCWRTNDISFRLHHLTSPHLYALVSFLPLYSPQKIVCALSFLSCSLFYLTNILVFFFLPAHIYFLSSFLSTFFIKKHMRTDELMPDLNHTAAHVKCSSWTL